MKRIIIIGFMFTLLVFGLILPTPPASAQSSMLKVVISPGHGLNQGEGVIDPGTVKGKLIEKDITLEVAKIAQEILERCKVDGSLTRTGDDPIHSPADLPGKVNASKPDLAISIHTAMRNEEESGTMGWYTSGGFDDKESRKLAGQLSAGISDWLSIPDLGEQPESKADGDTLDIHNWESPAALIELGDFNADETALTTRRRDFGRAIANAVLGRIGMPLTCADGVSTVQMIAGTYFPSDTGKNEIRFTNDGLVGWNTDDVRLQNLSGMYGAKKTYPLVKDTPVGKEAEWLVSVSAPAIPGIYQQVWQVKRGQEPVGKSITVYIVVLPQGAEDLKVKIDQNIEELRQKSQEEMESYIEELKQQAADWVTSQAGVQIHTCLGSQAMVGAAALTFFAQKRRKKL